MYELKAPIIKNISPGIIPDLLKTKGNDKTPTPIYVFNKAKAPPLNDPGVSGLKFLISQFLFFSL